MGLNHEIKHNMQGRKLNFDNTRPLRNAAKIYNLHSPKAFDIRLGKGASANFHLWYASFTWVKYIVHTCTTFQFESGPNFSVAVLLRRILLLPCSQKYLFSTLLSNYAVMQICHIKETRICYSHQRMHSTIPL